MRGIAAAVSLGVLIAILVAVAFLLHPFGNPPSQMDDYMIQNSQNETGTNNVVAAVLFDYRGLDTLGEATVLFTAVTGVVMLFRATKKKEEENK
jgi:multisubunit Na+/H+ antiporter MnhB subunit